MADHRCIFELAKSAASAAHLNLRPDDAKILSLVKEAIGNPRHYCRIARTDSGVTGVLIAFTAPCLWAQRAASHIVFWKAMGSGAALLRDYRRWVLDQPNLRVAGWQPDCDFDSRAGVLMKRVGFKRHGGAYLMFPREVRNGLFEQSR